MENLSKLYSVAEYDKMTGDEFQIHLFIESGDSQLSKIATELLGKDNPTMYKLKIKVKETENSTWYSWKKEYGKMANLRKEKFCKPCNSMTHTESECWAPCSFWGRRNHKKEFCKFKDNPNNQNTIRANRAAEKKEKKKKNQQKKRR